MSITKNFGIVFLTQIMLYFIQYIVMPSIFILNPAQTTFNSILLLISTILVLFVSVYYYTDRILYWAASFFVYPILVKVYHPNFAYGIGYDGFLISFNENVVIFMRVILVFFLRCLLY